MKLKISTIELRRIRLIDLYFFIKGKLRSESIKMDRDRTVIIDGFKMRLDHNSPHDRNFWRIYKSGGTYEPEITKIIKQNLQLGGRFVDIGANNGYFSLIASKIVGKKGKVIAFEPTHRAYLKLVRNIEINKFENVDAIEMALSDKEGDAYMKGVEDDASNSLSMSNQGELVRQTKFDSITNDGSHIDLIKCDIEGAEPLFLRGAEEFLKNNKHVKLIMEINSPALRKLNQRGEEIFDILKRNGFEISEIMPLNDPSDEVRLKKVQSYSELEGHILTNILAVR